MSDYNLEYVVDLWRTGAHGVEVGIKKEDELRAKSRQFTKDMDIFGAVEKNGEEYGYVAFRENPWKEKIPNRYVVIKLFSKKINWRASLEQLVAKSLMQSLAASLPLSYFMINVSKTDYLITLEKIRRKPKLGKSVYAFNIIDEDYSIYSYAIETDRMSVGSDWFIYDDQRIKIATIDGSKFNIGGKYTIKIDTTSNNYHGVLDKVLILFSALNRYLEKIEESLEKSVKEIQAGNVRAKVSKEEAMLYLNPRRIKM